MEDIFSSKACTMADSPPGDGRSPLGRRLAPVALTVLIAWLASPYAVHLVEHGYFTPDTVRLHLLAAAERYLFFWQPAPRGHGLPLGSHRPASPLEEGIDVLDEFPHPTEFYDKYLRPQRPALFRGLARRHPAYERWTDEYLRKKFGDMEVAVEQRKKEDREMTDKLMLMKDFLDTYRSSPIGPLNKVLVDRIDEEMAVDLVMPRLAYCGGLRSALSETVVWLSSGGTKSVLHTDGYDNMNCLLDGRKTFLLIDMDDVDRGGAYSSVDVDSVDLYYYRGLRDALWYNVTIEKGDCFYLPFKFAHHVYSYPSRALAVNMWFAPMQLHNASDCEGKAPREIPLSEVLMPNEPEVHTE